MHRNNMKRAQGGLHPTCRFVNHRLSMTRSIIVWVFALIASKYLSYGWLTFCASGCGRMISWERLDSDTDFEQPQQLPEGGTVTTAMISIFGRISEMSGSWLASKG